MITKAKKKEIVRELADRLSRQKTAVFFDYTGLKVNQFQKLRDKLREQGIDCQVSKKTLIDLALAEAGIKDVKAKGMEGQIGLILGYQDEVAPAKALYDFSKENENLKILSGLVNGEYLGNEAILNLAQLPSKQELLAKLVGGVSSPLYGFNNALRYNLQKLIFILKSYKI